MQRDDKSAIQIAIEEITKQYQDVWAIYLFGSFDTEYQRPDSDLDLAIIADGLADAFALWELAQRIAMKIHRNVDIADLRQASTVFQNEVIRQERRIFCNKPKECDALESRYLAMYLRLNEERKEIIQDLKGQCNG